MLHQSIPKNTHGACSNQSFINDDDDDDIIVVVVLFVVVIFVVVVAVILLLPSFVEFVPDIDDSIISSSSFSVGKPNVQSPTSNPNTVANKAGKKVICRILIVMIRRCLVVLFCDAVIILIGLYESLFVVA